MDEGNNAREQFVAAGALNDRHFAAQRLFDQVIGQQLASASGSSGQASRAAQPILAPARR